MAFGFTPKHIENIPVNDISEADFIVLAVEAVKKLGWKLSYTSDRGLIANTNNGIFSKNGEITITIENAIGTIKSVSTSSEMADMGSNKDRVKDFIFFFDEMKTAFSKDELVRKYEELKTSFIPPDSDVLRETDPAKTEQFGSFFSIFKPVPGYFVTPLLMYANIAVFLLMALSGVSILTPDTLSLLRWGANFKLLTDGQGEWWRLLSSCFVHIGILHLLFNMYALLYIGLLLEPILGRTRFIGAYLLTGILASMVSLSWNDFAVSAGASGAIFGMYGVFLALLTTDLIEKAARKPLLASIGVFVCFNLLYGMKAGVDNAAHVGGLVSGFVLGIAFIPGLKKAKASLVSEGEI